MPSEEYLAKGFLLRGSIEVVDCSEQIQGNKSVDLQYGGANLVGDEMRVKLSKGAVVVQMLGDGPRATAYYRERRKYIICE